MIAGSPAIELVTFQEMAWQVPPFHDSLPAGLVTVAVVVPPTSMVKLLLLQSVAELGVVAVSMAWTLIRH